MSGSRLRLIEGRATSDAFRRGIERVRWDEGIGEKRCPDESLPDRGPSPFKRLCLRRADSCTCAIAFNAVGAGELTVRELSPEKPEHFRIPRNVDRVLGREVSIARRMEQLLPAKLGILERKTRLVNLHGEGGIGKTRLAQAVCDRLEEYRRFGGGIYEVDCEEVSDSLQLALAVFKAMSVEEGQRVADPVRALPAFMEDLSRQKRDLLLFLDNVDELFAPRAGFQGVHPAVLLKTIFSQCDSVRILTTCRTRVGLSDFGSNMEVDPQRVSGCVPTKLHGGPQQSD